MDIVRKRTRHVRKAIVAIAAVVLITAGIFLRNVFKFQEKTSIVVDRSSIWTSRVRRGDLLRQVPVQGTLIPEHVEWLSAVSAARVAKIAVRPGAHVDKDTVVLVLENADLELAALEAERQAASAEAALLQLDVRTQSDQKLIENNLIDLRFQLSNAGQHVASANLLSSEGLMNKMEYHDALNKVNQLSEHVNAEEDRKNFLKSGRVRQLSAQRTEVERLREIAKFRRRQLAALEVRSTIQGIVQDIPLESGQWASVGTVLAKIAVPDRLKAEVRVAEGNAKDVYKGQIVQFEMMGSIFRGRIDRVDPTVINGSVRLEVMLDDPSPKGVRTDQTVTGHVEIERRENVLAVTRPAGVQDETTVGLFRFDPDGSSATRINVRFGRGSTQELEVVSGLSESDEIVVSDISTWEMSEKIRFKQ